MPNSIRSTAHPDHDLLLVASLADRDLTGDEQARARAQVDACAACASLHADLVSLARATRDLPPIARPRAFTLRPEDARRLRPNLLRRMVGAFGTSRDGLSRQLALGFTTIGLAGLLVGVLPGALSLGGATGALTPVGEAVEDDRLRSLGAVPGATQEQGRADGFGEPAVPAAGSGDAAGDAAGQGSDVEAFSEDAVAERDPVALAPDPSGTSLLIVLSGTFLIAGLGLFALRWTTRRFGG